MAGGYVPYVTRPSIPTLIIYPRDDGSNTSAFTNYYGTNPDRTPDPVSPNNYFYVECNEPFIATVDWGDGTIEEFNSVVSGSRYRIGWRGLKSTSYSGSDSNYTPEKGFNNNHFYGKSGNYNINMTFSKDPIILTCGLTCWRSFPNIGLYELSTLTLNNIKGISEIPSDRISKLENLTSLTLNGLVKLQQLPESITNMTRLVSFGGMGLVNFSDPDASNLRNLKNLVNLKGTLNLSDCNIVTITKEMVGIPGISSISIGSTELSKRFDPEITEYPSNITSMNYIYDLWGNVTSSLSSDPWKTNITKITNYASRMTQIYNPFRVLERMLFPPYMDNLVNISSIYGIYQFYNQESADAGVNTVYEVVTSNSNVTMTSTKKDGSRNQYYGLTFNLYDSLRSAKVRPTGTVTAPSGFVSGSSNGTPTTPGQKLYCLINNYKQVWNICPESAVTSSYSISAISDESPNRYDVIIVNGQIVSIEPDTSIHKSDLLLDSLYNEVDTFSIKNEEDGIKKLSSYLENPNNLLVFNSYFHDPIITE